MYILFSDTRKTKKYYKINIFRRTDKQTKQPAADYCVVFSVKPY